MRRIAILETDFVPDDLVGRYGTFPKMFRDMLAGHVENVHFEDISLVGGEPLPEPERFDGYIITGSRHAAYDDLPWIRSLEDFVKRTADARKPQVGICFGHQIMAKAFGGRVEKFEKGWTCGLQRYRVTGDARGSSMLEESWALPALHQDQVVEQPPESRLIATSQTCEFSGFAYDSPAMSFQFHPEFGTEILEELIRMRIGREIPPEQGEEALASIKARPDCDRAAAWIAEFLLDGDRRA